RAQPRQPADRPRGADLSAGRERVSGSPGRLAPSRRTGRLALSLHRLQDVLPPRVVRAATTRAASGVATDRRTVSIGSGADRMRLFSETLQFGGATGRTANLRAIGAAVTQSSPEIAA